MLNPPLKWHGGKHYLADWILSHSPPHLHYVEPYFGGGSVLLRKQPGASEVVNDLNEILINFWRVLQDPNHLENLKRDLEATPFSEDTFANAFQYVYEYPQHNGGLIAQPDRTLAWAFFVVARQSRQGLMKDFATLSRNRTRRGMNEQASSWLTAIEGLADVHERLKGVVILNRPALEVIEQQDGPNTWFYLDPPYPHVTRTAPHAYGNYEMTEADHIALMHALSRVKGKFTLSSYPNPIYGEAAHRYDWRCILKEVPNHAASGEEKRIMTEALYVNY